jgi:hypothetical protein
VNAIPISFRDALKERLGSIMRSIWEFSMIDDVGLMARERCFEVDPHGFSASRIGIRAKDNKTKRACVVNVLALFV